MYVANKRIGFNTLSMYSWIKQTMAMEFCQFVAKDDSYMQSMLHPWFWRTAFSSLANLAYELYVEGISNSRTQVCAIGRLAKPLRLLKVTWIDLSMHTELPVASQMNRWTSSAIIRPTELGSCTPFQLGLWKLSVSNSNTFAGLATRAVYSS